MTGSPGEIIQSITYRKPTSGNTLLHYKSHHPRHTTKSIPVGEMTGALRNCSQRDDYLSEINTITHRFRTRGYTSWVIDRAKNIGSKKSRTQLITNINSTLPDSTPKPVLVLEYNKQFHDIKKIVDKYLPIIMEDDTFEHISSDGWQTVSRRPITLGNLISPSYFSSSTRTHTWLK